MKTVESNEMVKRKVLVLGLVILLIMVIGVNYVSAVTGSIGNSRMIINAKTGDVIERTILVKNVNNISVAIEMFSSGDLGPDVKIDNPNFTLAPNQERKVNISIKVTKEGSTETKVNVKFTGVGEKGGVGLSSTIIINAEKGSIFDLGTTTNGKSFFEQYSMIIIGSSVTAILLIIFIVLLMMVSRKKKDKGMVRQKETSTKPKKDRFKS